MDEAILVQVVEDVTLVSVEDDAQLIEANEAGPAGPGTNIAWDEVPSGTVDGANATFTVAHTPTGLMLFLNGLKQAAGSGNDYTISGPTITFNSGCIPQPGDVIEATYRY